MKLSPETLNAHRQRHARATRYPVHTLAPDPHQPELKLKPRLADNCPHCGSVHTQPEQRQQCLDARR